jgi:hypothetical protein
MTTPATNQSPYRMNFTSKFRPVETLVVTRVVSRPVERDFRVPWISLLLGLLAGSMLLSVALFVYSAPKIVDGPRDETKSCIKALHAAAEAWRANHGNECPTVQRLKDEKELAASSEIADKWGTPYLIWCNDDATTVVSFGPDKKKGTEDDVVFPDPEVRR